MKNIIKVYNENERRIFEGTGMYDYPEPNDIRELLNSACDKYKDRTAFKYKKDGKIIEKTYIDFKSDVEALGQGLYEMGLLGEKIAVIGENRYEWGVCYLSIINGLGVGVPLDKYLPKIEIENLVERSESKAIFFSKAYVETMREIAKSNKKLKYYICMDEIEDSEIISLSSLIKRGKESLEKGKKEFLTLPIDREKMSILLFTSGTTNLSKGVMLSHKNITSNVRTISNLIKVYPTDVHLSLLPLHHTFENTIGFMFMVHAGVCIAYCEGIKHIAKNLEEFNVSVLVAVPAIFEVMYNRIQEGIEKSGKEKLLKNMMKVSETLLKLHIDLRKTLFGSVRNKVGKNLRLMVSGAAPIDKEIIKFFETVGITFLQGYGLTETAPLVCVNSPSKNVYGSVGFPMQKVKVTLDDIDENGMGELLVKGDNVMIGYFNNEEATKEAFTDDGWLRTGDLAKISEEGAISITGRAKSMIVFENGKKAFPEEYEVLINRLDCVKESFVWGHMSKDASVQICAKIVLSDGQDIDKAIKEIDEKIKEINNYIPKYKIIRYFVVTTEELTKTTTLKIKRNVEKEKMEKLLKEKNTDMRKINKTKV